MMSGSARVGLPYRKAKLSTRCRVWNLALAAAILAAAAPCPLPGASAATVRPMSALRDLVRRAAAAHMREIVIPPGIYRGGPGPEGGAILSLRGTDNLRIVARGVTMICTKRTRAIELDDCRSVELVGLTIDYDPLTFTQGTVTAVAPDKSYIDVKIDSGYPRMPYSRIDVVDPATRFRKHGMPFLWGTTAVLLRPDVVRVTLTGIGAAAPAGCLVSLNEGNETGGICHGITTEFCRGGIVLRDVTIYCAPGMGIVEHAGYGGTRLLGVRIVPGPPPPGASQPRLLTTSWDGILHNEVRHGPDVEHCRIESCGDDSWSVQSSPMLVLKSDTAACVLAGSIDLQPGDHLRRSLLDAPGWTVRAARRVPIAEARLDAQTLDRLARAPQWTLWSIDHTTVEIVTLAPPLAAVASLPPLEAGTWVYSPENQGSGFVFRGNYTHSSGRILIKASDGVVEQNTILDGHNVVVFPEVNPGGAFGMSNLAFRSNRIVGAENFNGMPWSLQAGGLCIAGDPDGAVSNVSGITIADNSFEDISAANIFLSGVRGATITGNRFIRPDRQPVSESGSGYGVDQASIICLRKCDGVRLAGNTILAPGSYERRATGVDASDTRIIGATDGTRVTVVAR